MRSRIVEPVLGTLINFLNMKRVNTRGLKQANKHVVMAATAYNLKKYLKFATRKSVANVQTFTQGNPGNSENCLLSHYYLSIGDTKFLLWNIF
ncbi:MAG: transposase [Bacteroidota bacterium]